MVRLLYQSDLTVHVKQCLLMSYSRLVKLEPHFTQ